MVEQASAPTPASPGSVFAIVSVGVILANFDLFSVNLALPHMAADFGGASLEDLSWVLNSYAIAYAALLVFFGRLAEGYRRERAFMLGLGIFAAAALACAFAASVWQLVAFRLIEAVGAALLTPASLGLLLASYPPERRAAAVRNWAAVGGLAAAAGPLVGGALVTFDWRWIFIVNGVTGLGAILIALRILPAIPGHPIARPSLAAATLVTVGIGTLIYATVKARTWGWTSPEIVAALAVAGVSLGAFVLHCLRSRNPLIEPGLFRIRPFTGAALAIFPYSIGFGAMLFSIALWVQSAWGWAPLHAGLAIIVGPLFVPVISIFVTGRLIDRIGAPLVVTLGVAIVIAGFATWAIGISLTPDTGIVVLGMALNGIGVGLTFPTLMGVSSQALPASSFATGSGVINMLRQAAIAFGVAIFVAILGEPGNPADRLAAFQAGWWIMAVITALTLAPLALLRVRAT